MIGTLAGRAVSATGGKPLATPGALLMLGGMGLIYWALSGWHLFGLGTKNGDAIRPTSTVLDGGKSGGRTVGSSF